MGILKMFTGPSALEKARSEAERIRRERDAYEADMNAQRERLREIESRQPFAIYTARMAEPPNGEAPPAAEAVRQLFQDEEICRRALAKMPAVLQTFNAHLALAMEAAIQAEAEEARCAADQFETEVKTYLAEFNRLKAAFEAFAQAEYMPVANHTRMLADVMTQAGHSLLGFDVRITIPKPERLQNQLAALRQEAMRLGARAVRLSGAANGTLEQLLEAIAQPLSITPSEASLRAWCAHAAAVVEAKWKASGDNLIAEKSAWYNGTTVIYSVQWTNGVIDKGTAKIELARGKTVTVKDPQELTGGAAYGT